VTAPRPLTCSHCGSSLPSGAPGIALLARCPGCGAESLVTLFAAFNRSAAPGQAPQRIIEEGKAACFFHPEKLATVPCDGCGRFLCALCDIELHGKHMCPACLEAGQQKGRLPALERRRMRYDQIVWSMVIVPLLPPLFFFVPWVTAPCALGLGLWKWNAPPSLIANTRLRLVLGMALAVLELVGIALFWKLAVWGTLVTSK
jgi:hypothetical protein